jgi:hypothetical protein
MEITSTIQAARVDIREPFRKNLRRWPFAAVELLRDMVRDLQSWMNQLRFSG